MSTEEATLSHNLQSIVESMAVGICSFDRECRITYMNPAAERLTGHASDDVVGREFRELLDPASNENEPYSGDESPLVATLRDGETRWIDHHLFRRRDGTRFPVRGHCARLLDGEDNISGAVVTFTEASASLEERRYRSLIAATSDFVWRMTSTGALVWITEGWLELVGMSAEEASGWGWLAALHPDDREGYEAAWQQAVDDDTTFEHEYRLCCNDGRVRWFIDRVVAVPGDDGRVAEWLGTGHDITDRREAEEENRRLVERLTSTFESITDAFFTLDRDWCVTYANRQTELMMGVDRADVLGLSLWSLYPDLVGTVVEHEYRHAMEENHVAEFEYYYAAMNVWFEIRAYPSDEGLAVHLRDITERKRAHEEIEYLALYDPLTNLPNRRLLMDRMDHALTAAERTGSHGAVLFLDLDNFKTLNDTLGHDVGDRLLRLTARRLNESVRRSDTVARFGGDEFAVILELLSADRGEAVQQARLVGEKVRESLARAYHLGSHERHTSVSVGITLFGGDEADSADEVMKRADLAMYQAKDAGRGTVRVYDPSMRAAIQSRVAIENALRKALDNGEIVPWYQPQCDGEGRLVGAEALARWLPADREPVSPREFIPVAEETGLILPLGTVVLEEVCTRIAAWASQPELARLDISVNVSPRQFHHPDFVEQVRSIIARTGVPTERLWLELTESLLLADVQDTIHKMTALRADGVRFTLDDFGTGYSSLAYLKRLPLDQLKIDQGFVQDALTNLNDAAIVRTIIVLAHTMEMQVVAEGVETEAVWAMLVEHGCTAYQGFLFGPAVPAEDFEALARKNHGAALPLADSRAR